MIATVQAGIATRREHFRDPDDRERVNVLVRAGHLNWQPNDTLTVGALLCHCGDPECLR